MDETIRAWATRRLADILAREVEHSFDLSAKKPLGSAVTTTALADGVREPLEARGYEVYTYAVTGEHACTYAYLREPAQALLDAHQAAHGSARVDIRAFVEMLPFPAVPQSPDFDLIADLYGDKTGPGRTDVLPGVDRRVLLRAFRDIHGFDDPTHVFFE